MFLKTQHFLIEHIFHEFLLGFLVILTFAPQINFSSHCSQMFEITFQLSKLFSRMIILLWEWQFLSIFSNPGFSFLFPNLSYGGALKKKKKPKEKEIYLSVKELWYSQMFIFSFLKTSHKIFALISRKKLRNQRKS